ncbi:MAG: PDZ domain-containing protein [Phycisphaerales bacterium]|nr:MAG: PDZ domain-containing protein [Phycisphaerales bacterium]
MLGGIAKGLLLSLFPFGFGSLAPMLVTDSDEAVVEVQVVAAQDKPACIVAAGQAAGLAKACCHSGKASCSKACPKTGKGCCSKPCMMKLGEGDEPKMWITGDVAGPQCVLHGGTAGMAVAGPHIVCLGGDADQAKTIVKVVAGEEGEEESGWLGVMVTNVPEALATQFDLEGVGVIVTNVVEGSPAEKAGMEQHDVIIEVDGKEVKADVQDLVKKIKSFEPGETVKVKILRAGEGMILKATLGSRGDMPKEEKWKWTFKPDQELEERYDVRAKIIVKGPDGEWSMKDLGDLEDLEDLPEDVRSMLPDVGKRCEIWLDSQNKSMTIEVDRDGETLIIEQGGDAGDIVVRRKGADGDETVNTYEDEEALETGDPEAYETFKGLKHDETFSFTIEDRDDFGDFHFDLKDWKDNMVVWKMDLEKALQDARKAQEEAMEQLRKYKVFLKPHIDVDRLEEVFEPEDEEVIEVEALAVKPKHSFDVAVDGSIIVTIRKGDSELIRTFRDEDDLRKHKPDLYEKYRALVALDEE